MRAGYQRQQRLSSLAGRPSTRNASSGVHDRSGEVEASWAPAYFGKAPGSAGRAPLPRSQPNSRAVHVNVVTGELPSRNDNYCNPAGHLLQGPLVASAHLVQGRPIGIGCSSYNTFVYSAVRSGLRLDISPCYRKMLRSRVIDSQKPLRTYVRAFRL